MTEASRRETKPEQQWVAGLKQADKGLVGRQLAYLILTMPRWIVRRVEQIELKDETTIRRRVSIDFALPEQVTGVPGPSTRGSANFVPLAYLRKTSLRNFDLRDERGAALPALTRVENGEMASATLAYLAEKILGHEPEADVLEDIAALTHTANEAEHLVLDRLFRQGGPSAATRFLLRSDSSFYGIARRHASNFLLITPLDAGAHRRVIKFAFDETPDSQRSTWQSFVESMSWRPTEYVAHVPGVLVTGSYHLEASAPAELVLSHAALVTADERTLLAEETGPQARMHLMVGTQRVDALSLLKLMAPRAGIIRTSLMTAFLTSAILTLGAFRLKPIGDARDGVATILVSVPAIIAAFIARPGEHALASRLLFGVRTCIVLSGLTSLSASALLLAGPKGVARDAIWWSLDGVALLMTALLTVSFIRSREGRITSTTTTAPANFSGRNDA